MTGSNMSGLAAGFLMLTAQIVAVILAIAAFFATGTAMVVLLVSAAILAAFALWLHVGIRRKVRAYIAHRMEYEKQQREEHPELFAALDQLKEAIIKLPVPCACGFQMKCMDPVDHDLFVELLVDDWDGDIPRSAAGVPYAELVERLPEEIGAYKVLIRTRKLRAYPAA